MLLVTAFGREEALKAAEGLPLAGVINKPVTPSTLVDTLGRVLGEDVPAATSPRSVSGAQNRAEASAMAPPSLAPTSPPVLASPVLVPLTVVLADALPRVPPVM